jgi:hypothetical protein
MNGISFYSYQNNAIRKFISYKDVMSLYNLDYLVCTQFSNQYLNQTVIPEGKFYSPILECEYFKNDFIMQDSYFISHKFIVPLEDSIRQMRQTRIINLEEKRLAHDLYEAKLRKEILHQIQIDNQQSLQCDYSDAIKEIQNEWPTFMSKNLKDSHGKKRPLSWFNKQFLHQVTNRYNQKVKNRPENN